MVTPASSRNSHLVHRSQLAILWLNRQEQGVSVTARVLAPSPICRMSELKAETAVASEVNVGLSQQSHGLIRHCML